MITDLFKLLLFVVVKDSNIFLIDTFERAKAIVEAVVTSAIWSLFYRCLQIRSKSLKIFRK